MNRLYQKTFDQVHMNEEKSKAVRDGLASRCLEMEEKTMKNKTFIRRPAMLVVTVVLICALSLTAFAYGERIYRFVTGSVVAAGDSEVSGCVEETVAPVEERDGRLYLVINGENRDITDLCSYTEPYIYTCTGEDGLQHAFAIGGDAGAIGWAEFFWDEVGMLMAGCAEFGSWGGCADAPWLDAAMETLGLPWCNQ